ncbi:TPA: DUF126 domain-containing protein [Candidatus Micrarchaeota archaeon]|nr:MAG: hypothetical protein AUJ65_06270 [Candidatus Micrarchaeota archaeon CG1_02_51_15]HII38866.1 DUF126 domain-containing protein [Candidatus Micrarchaeota archaeon]
MEAIGRKIAKGSAEGEALVSLQPISFYGGVDPSNGVIVEKGHELEGKSISGRVLVFPQGKGSTVGSYTLYRLKKNGVAPIAIINKEAETIVAVGAIISEIPMVDQLPSEAYAALKTGTKIRVNADEAKVTF